MSHVPAPLAVTGATGRIGGRVSALLADAGVPHRLVVRDPTKAPRVAGSTVHRASYDDSVETRSALDGVETLFMVSATEHPDRQAQHRAFVDAADAMGVQHVVYLSFFGAAPEATFTFARDHWATERHLLRRREDFAARQRREGRARRSAGDQALLRRREDFAARQRREGRARRSAGDQTLRSTGMAVTFLRDNLYADFVPMMVGPDDVIAGPGGHGRAAVVAQQDVARCVVAVLTDPVPHRGRTYDLTGPEAVSFGEIAELLTRLWGRPIGYRDETVEQAWESRRQYDAPDWMVEGWISTYLAVAAGELDGCSDDVRRLTGRDPLGLADVVGG